LSASKSASAKSFIASVLLPTISSSSSSSTSSISDKIEDVVGNVEKSLVSQASDKLLGDEEDELVDEVDEQVAASSVASSGSASAAPLSEFQPGEETTIEFENTGKFVESKLIIFEKKIPFPLWDTGFVMITKDLRSYNPLEEINQIGITVNNTILVFKNNKWINSSKLSENQKQKLRAILENIDEYNIDESLKYLSDQDQSRYAEYIRRKPVEE